MTYHAGVWLEKGLLSDFLTGDALTKAKADIRALEAKLHETWKGRPLSLFSFGYGKSEALFYLEPYNVPNNVFPVLWWPPLKNNTDRRVVLKRLAPVLTAFTRHQAQSCYAI